MLAMRPIAVKFKGEEGSGIGVSRDWLTQVGVRVLRLSI